MYKVIPLTAENLSNILAQTGNDPGSVEMLFNAYRYQLIDPDVQYYVLKNFVTTTGFVYPYCAMPEESLRERQIDYVITDHF